MGYHSLCSIECGAAFSVFRLQRGSLASQAEIPQPCSSFLLEQLAPVRYSSMLQRRDCKMKRNYLFYITSRLTGVFFEFLDVFGEVLTLTEVLEGREVRAYRESFFHAMKWNKKFENIRCRAEEDDYSFASRRTIVQEGSVKRKSYLRRMTFRRHRPIVRHQVSFRLFFHYMRLKVCRTSRSVQRATYRAFSLDAL